MATHLFVKAILEGVEITVYGDGEQTRDFTFVDDIVEANVLAAMSGSRGEVFNVGGGTRISVNELLEIMENVTGRRAVVKYIETQKGDVKDTLADADKIGKLGWDPRVGIEEGVRRFVGWYGSVSLKC